MNKGNFKNVLFSTGCIDVHGPHNHQRPRGMSRVCAAPWSHVDVHVEVQIYTASDYKKQENFFCSGIGDCRLTVENERHRRLLWHAPTPSPPSPQKNLSRQEAVEENS